MATIWYDSSSPNRKKWVVSYSQGERRGFRRFSNGEHAAEWAKVQGFTVQHRPGSEPG